MGQPWCGQLGRRACESGRPFRVRKVNGPRDGLVPGPSTAIPRQRSEGPALMITELAPGLLAVRRKAGARGAGVFIWSSPERHRACIRNRFAGGVPGGHLAGALHSPVTGRQDGHGSDPQAAIRLREHSAGPPEHGVGPAAA